MASIERQLFGHVAFDWRPDGLRCMISVPLCNTMGTTEVLESRGEVELATVDARIVLSGGSIMLVEDEAIVALAVNDALTDMGFSVVGPFSRISDACRALRDNQVDAAILDINLAGETVYSLAEMLTSRKIPFVFATGYGAESIEARFEHIAVLQKPIEKEMLTRVFVRPDMAQAPLV
jgi:CheY-like chemotaxis protein